MKKILFISALFLSTCISFGQETIKRNTLYAEAFGQGFCWSLNYDRLMNTNKRLKNSFSAGLVVVPHSMGFGNGAYYGAPVSYNWLLGKKNHHLEFGLGLTFLVEHPSYGFSDMTKNYTYLTPKLGYRFQRPQGELFLRATATPMVALLNVSSYGVEGGKTHRQYSAFENVVDLGEAAFPWVGFSIGYTF